MKFENQINEVVRELQQTQQAKMKEFFALRHPKLDIKCTKRNTNRYHSCCMIGNDIQDEDSTQANIPAPIPAVAPISVRRITRSTALLVQPMSVLASINHQTNQNFNSNEESSNDSDSSNESNTSGVSLASSIPVPLLPPEPPTRTASPISSDNSVINTPISVPFLPIVTVFQGAQNAPSPVPIVPLLHNLVSQEGDTGTQISGHHNLQMFRLKYLEVEHPHHPLYHPHLMVMTAPHHHPHHLPHRRIRR